MSDEKKHKLFDTKKRRENAYVRVVELGHQIVGTYTLHSLDAKTNQSWTSDTLYFSSFAVHPILHGLDIAKILMIEAQVKALQSKAKFIALHVNYDASGLQKLYQNFHFQYDKKGDGILSGIKVKGFICNLDVMRDEECLKIG